MPVLTVDYSRGAASALLINDDLSYKISRIPIVLPDIFYAHKKSYDEIFKLFVQMLEENFKVKIFGKMDIYIATVKDFGITGDRIKSCLKSDAFKALKDIPFMYFGHLHVGSGEGIFEGNIDYSEVLKELYFDEKPTTIINYFENFTLYPFLQPNSDRDFYEEEAYLKVIAKKNCRVKSPEPFASDRNMIFTTTRSLDDELSLCRFMLLCIESACSEGVFTFKLDQHDFLGAVAPLALLNKDFFRRIELPEFLSFGSVINILDNVSLTITTSEGHVHRVEVPKNEIFSFPVSEGQRVKVVLRSSAYGTVEKNLQGGVFGLVVDTRDKISKKPLLPDERKKYIKSWETILLENLKGL